VYGITLFSIDRAIIKRSTRVRELVFKSHCTTCDSINRNKNLVGIVIATLSKIVLFFTEGLFLRNSTIYKTISEK